MKIVLYITESKRTGILASSTLTEAIHAGEDQPGDIVEVGTYELVGSTKFRLTPTQIGATAPRPNLEGR